MTRIEVYDALVAELREHAKLGYFPAGLSDMPLTPDMTLEELGLDTSCKPKLLGLMMGITSRYFRQALVEGNPSLRDVVNRVV